ncbi:MAG TPA: Calx-beta domain-containing protein [Pyrinomonadaceae bacterium]
MLKTILVTLVSAFLLSGTPDSSLNLLDQQTVTFGQTGTLEKLIVANGKVSMDLDVGRLNGLRGKPKSTNFKFDVAENAFFTILVFNNDFRRAEPSSMVLTPQSSAVAPAALSSSFHQLRVESVSWSDQSELSIRDEKTGAAIFDIQGHQYEYDAKTHALNIINGRLVLAQEFAKSLGRPAETGLEVGTISISVNVRPIEITQVVNGETTSAVLPSVDSISQNLVAGPDVIVGDLSALAQFGSSSGGQVGLAVATDSCNAGQVPLDWFALPNNDHPVIPQNLYRMSGGTGNDERFEQVGQSNVKHAFTALQDNICGFGCSATASTTLGAGCSDPYSASLNSGQSNNSLGSRAWINPFTGAYPRGDSATPPNNHAGHTHTGPSHRLLVNVNDLNTTLNTGATYYVEAQYVTPHEYAWCQAHPGQCNMNNNASYRRFNVSGTTSFSFTAVGATERSKAAISAWNGATVLQIQPDAAQDGIGFIGYKVTETSPGVWHYEYAIYNQNLDRAVQSFSVPLGANTTLTNVGFHAPPQHPGWANDGTAGNAGYSSTPWPSTQTGSAITWSTETFAQNQNANAIRWGTLYNFRFDSDKPPQTSNATIGFFTNGDPITIAIQGPSVGPTLAINDVSIAEGNSGTTTANFTVSLSPASSDTVTVNYATANGSATAGSDYVSASGALTFTPGQTSQNVSVTINGDSVEEFNENFFVNLSNPSNATIVDTQGVGTINNDDVLANLQSGFNEQQITGLTGPTSMALHPDGRIFVCQQTGALRVIKNGAVLPTPFMTLTVNSSGERGLLGVAFDPNYATNHFIYVYYTATTPTIHNRVSRFTADSSNEDVVLAGSEQVLMDLETLGATNHNGGSIHFGPDGKLYIAVGENANSANAQSLSNRLGKLLRINSDGTIPADNPTTFPNIAGSTSGLNRAIWAVGLRNPYTFSFQPGTGRLHINDVGQNTWEEINVGVAGSNYGWPTCEGTCATAGMTNPIYQYSSATAAECAITGGAFYNPTTPTFPAQYVGKYFFADYCGGWLKTIDPQNPPTTGNATGFATGISSPVDIQVANDGSLYYLAMGSNSVFRIQYFGSPTLAVNDVSINEGNSGTSTATFNVTLSPASSQTVTVQYATANNTATAGTDFVSTSGTLTFAPGQTSQPVNVTINGDTQQEPNETFFVNLSSATNASIDDSQGVGTIINDDNLPTISISDATATEGNTASFTVSISNTSSQAVTVNYGTAGNTATSGTDFTATSGVATIPIGQLSTVVTVNTTADNTYEPNETFFVNLSSPTNGTISDGQGVGTITNDDLEPKISINDATVTEGNSGTTNAGFTISLSNPSFEMITVNYTTANGTASSGSDYVATSGTATFAPGTTTQPLNVTVNGDTSFETNETFNVNLSTPLNSSLLDGQGVGTINNDDTIPSLSISDVTVTEGNSGTVNATFTVSLSTASGVSTVVNYATADGTASAGSDYVNTSGTLTIDPGQASQTISVPVNGDTMFEPNETFVVNLSGPTNATIADGQGAGTITNDDSQPTISINDTSVNEGDTGSTTATLTVSLSNASSQTVSVNYATANDTAVAGVDYVTTTGTLNITPGQTSATINVPVIPDLLNEDSVAFKMNLATPVNGTISDNLGIVSIFDDDAPVLFTFENSQRGIALDSVFFLRDPFRVTNPNYFGADQRTRIILFPMNLKLSQGLTVTAEAVDAQQVHHNMTVESVTALDTFPGFAQVVVRLPDGITNAGDLQITITARGKTSNAVTVSVLP